ncbi:MAG: hypothetical protein Q4E46_00390 [Candidatus Saccharibacteria bacterium]|nr:hypothetical protein [Candidatus Saccharibacteria bacterium]
MNNDSSYPNYSYQPAYQSQSTMPNNPMTQPGQNPAMPNQPAQSRTSGILIALTVLFGLASVIFLVLFAWMTAQYSDASTNLESKIKDATIKAVDENTVELQSQFAEKEKSPFKKFAGPSDYGELTFNYPKTWSVYEYASASNGGDFGAVFNPDKITSNGGDTINALRVKIDNTNYENAIRSYEGRVQNGQLQLQIVQINGANANLYIGELDNKFQGAILIIKIRDKTVTFQTDAYSVFQNDFFNVLSSINYNA